MPSLAHSQRAMMLALEHGPQYVPGEIFAGSPSRIMAGMAIHANTISHGRLVALEETFPLTCKWLGPEQFNHLSRQYIDHHLIAAGPLNRIGAGLVRFLDAMLDDRTASELARFEWVWLAAYHAAEAEPLRLADLAGLDTAAVMELTIQRHPAARIERPGRSVRRLIGQEIAAHAQLPLTTAHAILLSRPGADVLVAPATAAMGAIMDRAREPVSLGNIFAGLSEPGCKERRMPDDLMQALIALLDAGALVAAYRAGSSQQGIMP